MLPSYGEDLRDGGAPGFREEQLGHSGSLRVTTKRRREPSTVHGQSALLAVLRKGSSLYESVASLSRSSRFEVRFHSDASDALASLTDQGALPITLVECSLRIESDGLDLCRAIRSAQASTWLMLAAPPEAVELRLEAFRIGVDDCLSTSVDARELDALLSARLEHLERSSGTFKVSRTASGREQAIAARAEWLARAFDLGPRETQILALVAGGSSPKEIGPRLGCSYATVRTHLRRLSSKLACSGTRELILRFFSEG